MIKILATFIMLSISVNLYAIVAGNSLNVTSSRVKTVTINKHIDKPITSDQFEDGITMAKNK
ncbi:hypothetical protein [Francisella philomiragia]|uniref:hypothetical protein n=1 Tax=Francisella philomiragia TaxID=28110 RepID=UPI00190781AF|nr:hypothetical protein [Francisella philomiragia]MBK2257513.1 hypothetical protein [Francisella philomiragia]MBK2270226.1 hypothetical protein [Francisella philomiragia]MBK2272053.1 hypothetical protein [Francisella philomiragia]MBK2275891.1 hypothetical protein [Francisella philomiragia]MBK2295412.1 hypothetical protein [Francisella philomiragia]